MRCEKCGTIAGCDDLFCSNCGQKFEQQGQQMDNQTYNATAKSVGRYCPNCGAEVLADAVFCTCCGANMKNIVSGVYSSGGYAYYTDKKASDENGKNSNGIIIAVVAASVSVVILAVVIALFALGNSRKNSDDDYEIETTTSIETVEEIPYTPKYESQYFYPSHERYITESELNLYSRDEVRLILNEMYARHGYIFKLEEYRSYFMQQPWYSPRYENQQTAQSFFNSYEEANRIAIIKYEESRGWR